MWSLADHSNSLSITKTKLSSYPASKGGCIMKDDPLGGHGRRTCARHTAPISLLFVSPSADWIFHDHLLPLSAAICSIEGST
jgi:hypothetical protein